MNTPIKTGKAADAKIVDQRRRKIGIAVFLAIEIIIFATVMYLIR